MTFDIKTFFDKATFTATHVLSDPESRQAAIIDSVHDFDAPSGRLGSHSADEILAFIESEKLEVAWILETHLHADHLTAAPYLKEKLDAPIGIGENVVTVQKTFAEIFNAGAEFTPDGSDFDRLFADGESFALGGGQIEVIATPGHTPACITYVAGDAAFVGDTLFMPDYGTARCDFPAGDARTLYRSIKKILDLPGDTRLFMCHDYAPGGRDFAWETTVAEQRKSNIHVRDGISEDEFVGMREARDKTLSMPQLILPSVQVNMRAGRLPPVESNGVHYLKLPIDQF